MYVLFLMVADCGDDEDLEKGGRKEGEENRNVRGRNI